MTESAAQTPMTYHDEKRAFLTAVSEFTATTVGIEEALRQWMRVAEMPFARREHTVNGLALFPTLSSDDPSEYPDVWGVTLYGPSDVERHRNEREVEGLGGEHSFLIGWLDGNGDDDAVFMVNARERRVAVLNHEDVFTARDLDALVAETADRQVLPIVRLVELLRAE